MSGPGPTVLGMFCVSCFLPNRTVFSRFALRKAAFSAILRCWVMRVRPLFQLRAGEAPLELKLKDFLKGIARVDDPFGARWSA
jgi:hypothetical protein